MKEVLSSAAKAELAELAGLFHNTKEACPMQITNSGTLNHQHHCKPTIAPHVVLPPILSNNTGPKLLTCVFTGFGIVFASSNFSFTGAKAASIWLIISPNIMHQSIILCSIPIFFMTHPTITLPYWHRPTTTPSHAFPLPTPQEVLSGATPKPTPQRVLPIPRLSNLPAQTLFPVRVC